MKLREATEGQVVRNERNGSYYRFERMEGTRCRIRPLELFPNGLLIAKPTDTIVEADLGVELMGAWNDEFVVSKIPSRIRKRYEAELIAKRELLTTLDKEAELIAPKERGSHANKVKAVTDRVMVIERGLQERAAQVGVEQVIARMAELQVGSLVRLPSGRPALLVRLEERDGDVYGWIRCHQVSGGLLDTDINVVCLRRWSVIA